MGKPKYYYKQTPLVRLAFVSIFKWATLFWVFSRLHYAEKGVQV